MAYNHPCAMGGGFSVLHLVTSGAGGSSVARYKWVQLMKNISREDCRQVEAGALSYYKLCGAVKITARLAYEHDPVWGLHSL